MKNFATEALTIGVIGAGTMGRGIAQIAAAAGLDVVWFDTVPRQLEDGLRFAGRMLDRQCEKGLLSESQCRNARDRLKPVDGLDGLRSADLVIEAIIENLESKRALFSDLETRVRDDCILASNTSSIPIALLAAEARVPSRIAGLHFFNPVPLMKIVEVIAGPRTAPAVAEGLSKLGERMGHFAPRVMDTPGFLVNHAGRGYALEALRIQSEGIAAPAQIDALLCDIAGFRMGPFALCDLIGIDVTHAVMESIYSQFYHEPRFKPAILTRQYRDAGLLGRKTGSGFYRYDDQGKPLIPADTPPPKGKPAPVWLGIDEPAVRDQLAGILTAQECRIDPGPAPGRDAVALVAPRGEDATTCAIRRELPPGRTVAIDTLLGLKSRICLMAPPVIDPPLLHFLAGVFRQAGHQVSLIHDSCGFVVQRVLANIVNVGCDIAQQRIAAPADIDKAVRLGLGYPMGPLAFGDTLGPGAVLDILSRLHTFYQDPRYRPSPWLKRRAMLGVSLSTPESTP